MKHVCHAHGCNVEVPPRLFMCGRHWSMVPDENRRSVLVTCRPGQERDKRPSHLYMVNHHLAVAAVAEKEGFAEAAGYHRKAAARFASYVLIEQAEKGDERAILALRMLEKLEEKKGGTDGG